MAFDPARLYSILLNTGLQTKNNPLYQVIYNLIGSVSSLTNSSSSSSSSVDTYAAPLTNGDSAFPELIFDSFGDVVMVTGLTTP